MGDELKNLALIFEDIYLRYGRRMYSMAYWLTKNKERAEELTQETFFKAFENFTTLKDYASIFPWLRSIMLNTFRDHLREKRELSQTVPEQTCTITPYEIVRRKEDIAILKSLINSMPENERIVIDYSHLQGLTDTEIAQVLGISVNNVRVMLHRARRNLQERLRAYFKLE